ncbi:MAG: 3-hydroxyacyl-CoA dehydrogenase NAD-binding domain-containing protein [Thermodesulfobacteriota bacterium]|jgi:3-hydroxybutyryl-CoA dehydrogenase
MPNSENIAVIGAGLMGHGIAQIFASQGHQVALLDVSEGVLAEAIENIRTNLTLMAQNGIGRPEEIEPTIKRIKVTRELEEAATDIQFVIEAVSEDLDLKQKLFQELDSICSSDCILATNTSVISITEIAARASKKDRILGTHFWNPPYLIPLVEVIKGQETSPQVVDLTVDLLRSVGKHPVKVKKDVPGFVGNRLQHALWREAISIIDKGIADPETVDEVIKKGFGIRLPVLGPIENADMVGLDLTMAIHDYILKHLESSPEPAPLLKEKVKKGELGFKTGQGFRRWSMEEVQRSRKKLLEYLLKWTNEQKGK